MNTVLTPTAGRTALNLLVAVLFCIFVCPQSNGQSEEELFTTKVVVVDEDGTPVTGAQVEVHPGYSVDNRTHFYVAKELKSQNMTTNQSGIITANILQEKTAKNLNNGAPTKLKRFIINVKHDDFMVHRGTSVDVENTYRIVLKRGVQLAIEAVQSGGKKITDDVYALTPHQQSKSWKRHGNGMLVSPVFPRQSLPLRVVHAVAGSPTLFSKEIMVDPGVEPRVLLRSIKLQAGVRVEGRLDDSVQRPVKHGLVTVHISGAAMDSESTLGDDNASRILWSDYAEIKSDGTFVFESLPRNCVAQFFANCEGWTNGPSNIDDLKQLFPQRVEELTIGRNSKSCLPQVLALKDEDRSLTLAMNKTTELSVRLIDFDGNPAKTAHLEYQPRHILCNGMKLEWELIRSTPHHLITGGAELKLSVERGHRFGAAIPFDENGEATLMDFRIPDPEIYGTSPTLTTIEINEDDGQGVLELQVRVPDKQITVLSIQSTTRPESQRDTISYDFEDFIKDKLDLDRY